MKNKQEMGRGEEKKYQYWLHCLSGVGDRTIEKLLHEFGSARQIYMASGAELGRIINRNDIISNITSVTECWDLDEKYDDLAKRGINFYTAEDKEYPNKLRNLIHPPFGVYCLGQMPAQNVPSLALIGARECSQYGIHMAETFGRAMAEAGVQVISGMARGIDGVGQRASLQKGGKTWAVLGCGVDVCYPKSNQKLYQEIVAAGGGILSVVPPGTEPVKRLFPERNRIVAGLCDALLVVEARQKSGTWITVDMALEQGKSVYAVPGRLTDRLSDGCNMLIRQGAGIVLSPEDLLEELHVLKNREGEDAPYGQKKKNITTGILRFLDFYPKSVDEIAEEIKAEGIDKSFSEILTELVEACLTGEVKQVAGSYFSKNGRE